MKYLKTFEKFNPLVAAKNLIDKWLTKDESTLIDANWDSEELKELINVGFDGFKIVQLDNIQYYRSKTKDFKIIVKK